MGQNTKQRLENWCRVVFADDSRFSLYGSDGAKKLVRLMPGED